MSAGSLGCGLAALRALGHRPATHLPPRTAAYSARTRHVRRADVGASALVALSNKTRPCVHDRRATALTTYRFTVRFSSTPRGARPAGRLCGTRLDAWGIPYGSDAHDVITLVTAELCANAVRHGHVAGRDFDVRRSTRRSGNRARRPGPPRR